MPGLSRRTQRFSRWLIAAAAVILFIACEAFTIYLLILKGRLDRELLHHTWREPTILLSAAHDAPSRVATLYGVDWRGTPPGSVAPPPAPRPHAFIAAPDVRLSRAHGGGPIRGAGPLF